MRFQRALLLSLCTIILLSVSVAQGQTSYATVNGLVLDSSGSVVPGAMVQAIKDDTNVAYSTATNNEGVYSIPDLLPGRYHIQVSKPGFKTLVKPDIVLNVQDARAINFTLQVGAVSEVVTVQGGACGSPIICPISISPCDPFIPMVKAAKFRDFDNRAVFHDLTVDRAFFFQREVRTGSVVILKVPGQCPLQTTSVQDYEMIQALPSYRSD